MTPSEYDDLLTGMSANKTLTHGEALVHLRERGASMIQAIKAMTLLFGMPLGTAKEVAARHPSWQRIHEAAKPLHDALLRHVDTEPPVVPANPPLQRAPGR